MDNQQIPEKLIIHFTHDIEQYSIAAAARNPVFGADAERVRKYINEELLSKEHSARENTDYKEDTSQIDSIENINILYLIKNYIDFFKNKDNLIHISKMLSDDLELNHFSEIGGIVIASEQGYEFVQIESRFGKTNNLENNESYAIPSWFQYIGHIGDFHFHATTENDQKYSGPSGSASSDSKYLNGDFGILRQHNAINPYSVNCVITKLKEESFNVDIYFRDVIDISIGKINSPKVVVLDLGNFKMAG